MAEAEIARHVAEAERRWPLLGVTVIHRYGRIAPGENIVLVVTASSHRQAAFAAAEFLMDYLKTRAPFWKQEERAARRPPGSTPSRRTTRPRRSLDEAAAARRGEGCRIERAGPTRAACQETEMVMIRNCPRAACAAFAVTTAVGREPRR